jgi:hypothetical protein
VANNFKNDDSFLKKLVIGATGTNITMIRLRELGFNPIELERGSTGFKIWKKIKIKRVRVPDILCLNTGMRFESRGKTKPEISMSHSTSDPKRAWDAGLRDDDYVSIVVIEQSGINPTDIKQMSPIHFINVRELREAFSGKKVAITKPKGTQEGSEIRVLWPCAVANQKSVVDAISDETISLNPVSGDRKQTIRLSRGNGKFVLRPQFKVGNIVEANQIVASIVPVNISIACPNQVEEKYFIEKLKSVNLSERYAAAKALRLRGYKQAQTALQERMNDAGEDIYVQLEAAAALAAYDNDEGWEFMEAKLRSSVMMVPLETQLETVIVASEIQKQRSEDLIVEVLRDASRDVELRAGAAWALGQFASESSANALVDTFKSSPVDINVEAARALLRIAEPQKSLLIELLKKGDPSNRDGISWVLAKTGNFKISSVVDDADDNLRRWISYIIGFGKDKFAQTDLEYICKADPNVYFSASVLWQIIASWVYELKEY